MLKQNWQLGGRGVCVPLVWHRCWCHQSSEPTVKTLSGPGPGGYLGTPPPPGFPLAPSSRTGPIPAPEAAPGDPQPRPSPSLPHGVGPQVLLPSVFWGQIPAFLAWERAGKQPQALSSKEFFFAGLHFSQFLLGFLFVPPLPEPRWSRGDASTPLLTPTPPRCPCLLPFIPPQPRGPGGLGT